MSLKETLMQDLKSAMKEKDQKRKDTITLIRASIKQYEVDNREELDDEGVLEIIAKQLKEVNQSIDEFEKGHRDDLVKDAKMEKKILLEYLPDQLTDDELEQMIQEVIDENDLSGMKDMGPVMKEMMPKVKGKADGKRVSKIASRLLK